MIINIDKVLSNKIYLSGNIKISTENTNNQFAGIIHDGNNNEKFVDIVNGMRYVPNNKHFIYYPEKIYNPATLSLVSNNKNKLAFDKWLMSHLKNSSKLSKLEIPASVNVNINPVIFELSSYFANIDAYIAEHKESIGSKYSYLKLILPRILTEYKDVAKRNINLLIDVDDTAHLPSILFFIAYGLRKDFEECNKIFEGYSLFITNIKYGIFCKVDIADKKKCNQSLNLISKFIDISKNFDAKALLTSGDNTMADAIHTLDISRGDTIKDTEDEFFDKFKTTSAEVSELADATTAEEHNKLADHTSEDNVDVLDVSEIINTSSAAEELESLKKENQEFITKFKYLQDKALDKFAKEAALAATDSELIIDEATDNSISNRSVKSSKINSITKSYYQKLHKQDLLNIVKFCNNDIENPLIVTNFEIKDNSDPLFMKDELSIQFQDKKGKRHTFTVDLPKLSHDGFLYINGNKKFIAKQATLLPVIKEAVDRVQITTNYKKTFLYRKNDKTSGHLDKITKVLVNTKYPKVKQIYGNNFLSNLNYSVSIPYNYIGKKLYAFSYVLDKNSEYTFMFNQTKIREKLVEAKFSFDVDKWIPVGYKIVNGKMTDVFLEGILHRKVQQFSVNTGKSIREYPSLLDLIDESIMNSGNKDLIDNFKSTTMSKALGYTEIKILSVSITLGILVCFFKGLEEALKLYGIKYTISEKRRDALPTETMLRFKDLLMYIDSEGNTAKELFINGLYYLNTKDYEFKDAERRGALYLEYFGDFTGSRNNAKGLLNFESSMIDPITLEVLKDMNLPTDFIELLLYGNSMLADYNHKRKNDMSNFRIRDSEVINVAVFNAMMFAFNDYKRNVKSGVQAKMTTKKDAVTKALMDMPNVEDYSILSPFLELEIKAKTTFKGPSGLNSSDSYTEDIRAYDPSMLGLFGIFTPVSGEVGINRSMSFNPKITNARGYLANVKTDDLDMTNLYAPGELLNIFTVAHSDPMRVNTSAQFFNTQHLHS